MEHDEKMRQLNTIQHYFDMERYEEAVSYISSVLKADPTNAQALYCMAVVMLSRKKYSEARALCEDAIKYGIDEETGLYFLGITYQNEKKYKEAEIAYLRALHINPNSPKIHAAYGELMLLAGFDEKAIALLEEAYRLDPDNEEVNQILLDFFFAKSNKAKQFIQIQRIMETSSSEKQQLINLGLYHLLQDKPKEARKYYVQAFLMDPTNTSLLTTLETLDQATHALFLPHRIIDKIGGPAVLWIGYIVLLIALVNLGFETLTAISMILYLILVIYTWMASSIYKWFVKGKWK